MDQYSNYSVETQLGTATFTMQLVYDLSLREYFFFTWILDQLQVGQASPEAAESIDLLYGMWGKRKR